MTESIKLSVVIISYRASKYLVECVNSILDTIKSVPFEIIIVNNGPIDPQWKNEILCIQKAPYVNYFKTTNNGYGAACNVGMKISRGEYIAIMNDDIKIREDALSLLLDFIDMNPKVGVVGPRLINTNGLVQKSYSREPSVISNIIRLTIPYSVLENRLISVFLNNLAGILKLNLGRLSSEPREPKEVESIIGAIFVTRKIIFEKTGGFDDKNFFMFNEEAEWFKRIRGQGYSIIYFPNAEVMHLGSATTSQYSNVYLIQQYKSFFQFYRLHRGNFVLLSYIIFLTPIFAVRAIFSYVQSLVNKKKQIKNLEDCETNISIIRVFFDESYRNKNVMRDINYKHIKKLPD